MQFRHFLTTKLRNRKHNRFDTANTILTEAAERSIRKELFLRVPIVIGAVDGFPMREPSLRRAL